MIELPSNVEGKQFDLYKLEQALKPIGYSIGGGWEYSHGTFDYKIGDVEDSYLFLRVPFSSVDGQLDSPNCTVELGTPFLIAHKYQGELDDNAGAGTFSGTINQFSEPVDQDAHFPEKYIETGRCQLERLEAVLIT